VDADCDDASDHDADTDGFDAEASGGADCDDTDSGVNPDAIEVWYDGIDADCDGASDDDADSDGFDSEDHGGTDCDDSSAVVNPDAVEIWYDGIDADCAGDDDSDADDDGFGAEGYSGGSGDDCDDADAETNPDADELCLDGIDNDCDGVVGHCERSLADAHVKLLAESADDDVGGGLAAAGDVDGDGLDDLLIGARYDDDGGSNAGALYVVYGAGLDRTSGDVSLATADGKWTGESAEDQAGWRMAGIGDINADGLDDIVVGAQYDDTADADAGSVYLVHGPITGTSSLYRADARITGSHASDRFAYGLDGGDFNRDGTPDILLSSANAETGGGDAGAACIVFGPVSGSVSLASADLRLTGDNPGGWTGYDSAFAGDVDGDGFLDLLVGAPQEDYTGDLAGRMYLVLGPASGTTALSTIADARWVGEDSSDRVGMEVAAAGDVNGDGLDDILTAAYPHDGDLGRVYLILGRSSVDANNAASDADALFDGEVAGDKAGYDVDGAGDVDGDGFADVLIGAPFAEGGSGAAYLVLGSVTPASITLSDADAVFSGETADDGAGLALAGAGDVDGDGLSDLLIGAWAEDSGASDGGAAYLLFGAAP